MQNARMCVRCRVVAVPDGLYWCPDCLAFLSLEASYLQSLEIARGSIGPDESAEAVADELRELKGEEQGERWWEDAS